MTLDNLAKIGRLKAHVASVDEVADLLNAALRNLDDAHADNISPENRFDAAYKCIQQSGLVGLLAHGFRPDTKAAGHHQTVIQSLPKTIGLDVGRIAVLDALRNKRNLSDYTGRPIDLASLDACIDEARRLLMDVIAWLIANRRDLLPRPPQS
ncbi:MAG TPA: hypothetical protein VF277_00460 [Steroidobacteraceae bacterium]